MQSPRSRLLARMLCILTISLLWGSPYYGAASDVPLPAGLTALREPQSLPEFEAPGVNGTTVRSADFQGQVMVLRFWASW
jgi:hypothetical protein